MHQIGLCGWSSIIELRQMRPLRAVSVPCSVHTGGKSEVQLTKKQVVLLMHDTLPQGVKSVCALLQNQERSTIGT